MGIWKCIKSCLCCSNDEDEVERFQRQQYYEEVRRRQALRQQSYSNTYPRHQQTPHQYVSRRDESPHRCVRHVPHTPVVQHLYRQLRFELKQYENLNTQQCKGQCKTFNCYIDKHVRLLLQGLIDPLREQVERNLINTGPVDHTYELYLESIPRARYPRSNRGIYQARLTSESKSFNWSTENDRGKLMCIVPIESGRPSPTQRILCDINDVDTRSRIVSFKLIGTSRVLSCEKYLAFKGNNRLRHPFNTFECLQNIENIEQVSNLWSTIRINYTFIQHPPHYPRVNFAHLTGEIFVEIAARSTHEQLEVRRQQEFNRLSDLWGSSDDNTLLRERLSGSAIDCEIFKQLMQKGLTLVGSKNQQQLELLQLLYLRFAANNRKELAQDRPILVVMSGGNKSLEKMMRKIMPYVPSVALVCSDSYGLGEKSACCMQNNIFQMRKNKDRRLDVHCPPEFLSKALTANTNTKNYRESIEDATMGAYLRNCHVIGTTTTYAAVSRALLEMAGPAIVLVNGANYQCEAEIIPIMIDTLSAIKMFDVIRSNVDSDARKIIGLPVVQQMISAGCSRYTV